MNIVFDIGGVLTDFDWDGFVRAMYDEETAQVLTKVMWKNPDWAEFDKALRSDEEILRLFIQKAPAYEMQIRHTFARLGDCQKKKESSIPLIEKLKQKGFRVFYLSNYFEYLMHVAPDALNFLPLMDGGVFSCYEHVIKPDERIFRILCERYDLKPEDCIFIDDSAKNVAGAERSGLKAIHYCGESADVLYGMIAEIAERDQ